MVEGTRQPYHHFISYKLVTVLPVKISALQLGI
jgi:hypothetical protein